MVHYRKSWQSGGTALITTGIIFLGFLVFSLKQYIVEKDFVGIILLSVLGLVCIISGILIKRYARKNGKE